jgi:23S rRNA maturation-related 3'-5' exoribonuclease YhaM
MEINFIKDEKIKKYVLHALIIVPEYFFIIPASSSGKYHPSYALGDGGLVRHTKAAVRIANEMFRMEMYDLTYTPEEKDLIIASLILHDTYTSGVHQSQYTVTEHPIVAVEQFKNNMDLQEFLTDNQKNILYDCILHHMGQWVQDYKTKKEVLEKPQTKIAKFVHMCDYLASRKCLEFNFEV